MSNERINSGYASFQLHRAFQTAQNHKDKATREHARERAEKWAKAIAAIQSGQVQVGSRTPVKEMPKWLTLEVVTGGFALQSNSARRSKPSR